MDVNGKSVLRATRECGLLVRQVRDSLLLGEMVGRHLLLEGRRPVLEKLFLPAVEDRGLQTQFIAEL